MQGPAPRAAPTLPPLRLLVERRFPLELNVTLPQIRELYDSGKAGRWNPQRDIDWSTLAADAYDAPMREAARRTWSRRLWMEVTGLTETPALLVRFCMETGRESDPKFFSGGSQHRRSLAYRMLSNDHRGVRRPPHRTGRPRLRKRLQSQSASPGFGRRAAS